MGNRDWRSRGKNQTLKARARGKGQDCARREPGQGARLRGVGARDVSRQKESARGEGRGREPRREATVASTRNLDDIVEVWRLEWC